LKGKILPKRYKGFAKRKRFSYEDIKVLLRRDKDFAKVEV
jgi:hypothetical protein